MPLSPGEMQVDPPYGDLAGRFASIDIPLPLRADTGPHSLPLAGLLYSLKEFEGYIAVNSWREICYT